MDETDKDYRRAFEEVTTRNVQVGLNYAEKTRKMVLDYSTEIKDLRNLITSQEESLAQMKAQLTAIQVRLYKGGTQ